MSKKSDRALRFYNEVLGLERLHYGIWKPDDALSIEKLKEAQDRYNIYLVDNLHDSIKRILDVGCGTGVLTEKLISLGYDAEGLSPDINQKKIFTEKLDTVFHHLPFEDFTATEQYDCLIMSESCQYISIEKVFENSRQALKDNGYLMICDYFILKDASGEQSKSGHSYGDFMKQVESNNFKVVKDEDITASVTKTLDLGKDIVEKGVIALDIGTEKLRDKYPNLTRLLLWLFRKKIKSSQQQIQLLDSKEFSKNKAYRFILLQAQ